MSAETTKLKKIGASWFVRIPEQIRKGMRLVPGDVLAIRAYGDEKLAIERIPMEKLAILKSPLEATPR